MKIRPAVFIIVVALSGFISLPCFAREVTSEEAITVADHLLNKLGKSKDYSRQSSREIKTSDYLFAYSFDLEPRGYVVVSASTSLPPVMAYSFESDFGDLGRDNPLFVMLTADLLIRMKLISAEANPNAAKNDELWIKILNGNQTERNVHLFEQWPPSGDGWLKTNWTQSAPYNNYCPMDPVTGTRSYAGCPATAMAQILNFHNTTSNTHFDDSDDYYHNYAGRQYWIDDGSDYADFPSFPELNILLDTLNAHYLGNIQLTNDDKAALTFACGVAARQVFTSQGSGTFGVSQAYEAYLRFGCSSVELLDSTDADLYERLKRNIKDTLPAHLAIVDSAWLTGHNVVVDGYNTDDYFHLNFGWGGPYNGWYLLPQEIPYELTVIEGIVVDIMKKDFTGIKYPENASLETVVFPNPAGKNTFLNFCLSAEGSVTLRIANISGKEILKYEMRNQAPGNYSFPLNLEDQAAGIYVYTLQTTDGVRSGKIVRVD